MPRTWILSDLHLETFGGRPFRLDPPAEFDLLVVAGDTREGDPEGCVEAVARLAGGRPSVMVLGNHDLYGCDWDEAAARAAERGRGLGVRVLEGGAADVLGLRVCGGTLWDDVGPRRAGLPRPDLTHILSGAEPDFAAPPQFMPYGEPIRVACASGTRRATFADVAARRAATLDAIAAAEPDLVVTHYPPDAACLARAPGAAAWVHGHVHGHERRMEGGVEVLLNARQSRAFAERMVVSIEPRGPLPAP
jgi:hypothetical protein